MALDTILVTLSAILAVAVAYCIKKFFSKTSNLEYYASKLEGPFTLPLIGSGFYFLGSNKRIAKNVVYLMRKYKSPWRIWLGRQLYVILTEPEDIEIVLNQALEKPNKYKFTSPVLEEGLFTGPVAKWKRHRKVITTTFSMPILNSFVQVFSEHAKELVRRLESQAEKSFFDIYPVLREFGLEVTCETAMGQRNDRENQNFDYTHKLARAMEIIFKRLFQYWLHPSFIWGLTSYSRELTHLSKELNTFVNKIVLKKIQEFRVQRNDFCQEPFKRKCFMDHLVELSETSKHWTNEEILEEAKTMVAAGSESVGSTAGYVLMMIGMYPSVQSKVLEEIHNIFGDNDREVTSQDLPKMEYLERVIKETLRLFPVAANIGRRLDKNIVNNNYTLPAGCECLVPILYIHRDPKIWQDPCSFNPDRFLPEEVSKRHPFSYLPFSGGPRNCIGFKYAIMVIKTAVSTIVKKYEILTEFENISDVDFEPGVVLKSAKGYRVALERRKN